MTQASGDKGVDIVASHSGRRAIIQGKFYTSTVGIKAVQEAVAARIHEQVVITKSTYTQYAEELAHTTGAILIYDDDIPS